MKIFIPNSQLNRNYKMYRSKSIKKFKTYKNYKTLLKDTVKELSKYPCSQMGRIKSSNIIPKLTIPNKKPVR